MPMTPHVERRTVATRRLDPAAALARLLGASDAGFVLEREDGAVVGVAPSAALRLRPGGLVRERAGKIVPLPGPVWKALAREASAGAFGLLHYEAVRHLEKLPLPACRDDGALFLYDDLLHFGPGGVELVSRARRGSAARVERFAAALEGLRELPVPPPAPAPLDLPAGRLGRARFLAGVRTLKERIRAGDIFQAVLSDSFEVPFSGDPFALYSALRAAGPVPYRFLIKDGARVVLGASPERLVRVEKGVALNNPIAGTRPRGRTAAEDARLERQMTRSPKERAEHLMLVDLGRNDLGRVCAPGSVRVRELMKVRKFSNVMHLVSVVEGKLERGASPWEALAASFPAGTVSGAPKVRAMELVAELEAAPRGFYSGAAVFADFTGDLDAALSIRCVELSHGRARFQAGAGIVADSRPEAEWLEVSNKLLAIRRALAAVAERVA